MRLKGAKVLLKLSGEEIKLFFYNGTSFASGRKQKLELTYIVAAL